MGTITLMTREIDLTYYTRKGELRSRFRTYYWIIEYAKKSTGPTPTVAEIANGRRLSRTTIRQHLAELVDMGYIKLHEGKISVVNSKWIPPSTLRP